MQRREAAPPVPPPPSASPGARTRRNLVYTSAGDRAKLAPWLRGRRNFDLWITYYGDRDERAEGFRDLAEHYQRRKGAKFPNLYYDSREHPEVFDAYDAVLVMDDDIRIDGSGISRLFDVRDQHDLWLLQPAFHPRGRLSHAINCLRASTSLRFTDFVEVTCPMFRMDKLREFLEVYDPELVGWGADWWFCEVIGGGPEHRIAVVDAVPCVNPRLRRDGVREIDQLQSAAERKATWERIKAERGLIAEALGSHEFGSLPRPWPSAAWTAFGLWAGGYYRRRKRHRRRRRRQLARSKRSA